MSLNNIYWSLMRAADINTLKFKTCYKKFLVFPR